MHTCARTRPAAAAGSALTAALAVADDCTLETCRRALLTTSDAGASRTEVIVPGAVPGEVTASDARNVWLLDACCAWRPRARYASNDGGASWTQLH